MSWRKGTAVALLVSAPCWVALGGCGDQGNDAIGEPSPTSEAPAPRQPSFTGRLDVIVQPALGVVNDEAGCTPAHNRACSADGQAYVPITEPAPATLVEARARLAEGHTAWTTVLRFDAASRAALTRAAERAGAAGGLVLVMDDDQRVLAAAPFTLVRGRTIVFDGLDKPGAWALVETFEGGRPGQRPSVTRGTGR